MLPWVSSDGPALSPISNFHGTEHIRNDDPTRADAQVRGTLCERCGPWFPQSCFFRISGLIWSCQISETWVFFVLFCILGSYGNI
jgi:hypothetical protein